MLYAIKGTNPPEKFKELAEEPNFSDRVYDKANKFNNDAYIKTNENVDEVRVLKELQERNLQSQRLYPQKYHAGNENNFRHQRLKDDYRIEVLNKKN